MKSYGATIQMKATESYWAEQYFPMVLFIMLRKVVLTFESVDEILKYDHSHDSPFYLSRSFSLRTAPTIWTPGTSYCLFSVPHHSKWIKIKTKPFNRRSPESGKWKDVWFRSGKYFVSQDIRGTVLPRYMEICMETPRLCPPAWAPTLSTKAWISSSRNS